ncbi:MAG: substrate-binding domain-containing protein [Candidatus Thorarchaeota archaeon]
MRKEVQVISVIIIVGIIIASTGYYLYLTQTAERETLVVSTTTSLYDTGLLDQMKDVYESVNNRVILAFISAGTGIALENAKRGDADMILVHSPSQELGFMQEQYGVNRKIFAYNFFTIVGPPDDPVKVLDLDPLLALEAILEHGRVNGNPIWVSRDDASGTNTKEIGLWTAAGYNYSEISEENWFISSGTGMGTTLNLADEQGFYTLSDIGTFLKYKVDGLIELDQMVDEGQSLLNVYSAIAVNRATVTNVKFEVAMEFIQWLVGSQAQDLIESYGQESYGASLFFPAVDILESHLPAQTYQWIQGYAFFDSGGTLYECPPALRSGEFGIYP